MCSIGSSLLSSRGLLFLVAMSVASYVGAYSQSTLNEYYPVVCPAPLGYYDRVVVNASAGSFVEGDRILVIQNKGGAVVERSDSFNPGDKGSGPCRVYNTTGRFLLATVESVQMGTSGFYPGMLILELDRNLCFSFEGGEYSRTVGTVTQDFPVWGSGSNGVEYVEGLQVVKVPRDESGSVPVAYDDLSISQLTSGSTLTASSWNGQTGGVVVLECTGTLTIDEDIDVSGLGYRGGRGSASLTLNDHTTRTKVVIETATHSDQAGEKGEGITHARPSADAGRGAAGNGGGGGNKSGAGGGGGANGGAGGVGGRQRPIFDAQQNLLWDDISNGGIGGIPHDFASLGTRVFFGGGGGGGQIVTLPTMNPVVTDGAAGGGIIILIADEIVTGSGELIADGDDASNSTEAGAGGGGAGGTIVLMANSVTVPSSTSLSMSAQGGDGGDVQSFVAPFSCFGPGGGGGGGRIWLSLASLQSGVTAAVSGGAHGVYSAFSTAPSGCSHLDARDAEDGEDGSVSYGFVLPGDCQ